MQPRIAQFVHPCAKAWENPEMSEWQVEEMNATGIGAQLKSL